MSTQAPCVFRVSASLLTAFCFSGTVSASLITNGDFSGGAAGWTSTGPVSFSGTDVGIGGGSASHGAIHQTISTTAGSWYQLSYDHRQHNTVYTPWTLFMATAYNGAGTAAANGFWGASSQRSGTTFQTYTRFFQAAGSQTTLQLTDYNFNGSSQDVYLDNIVVTPAAPSTLAEVNIARLATLSQSSYYDSGAWPASMATDGVVTSVVNNFMHTADTESDADPNTKFMDLTFAQSYDITRIALSPRWGFLTRAGTTVSLYNAADAFLGSFNLGDGDGYYSNATGWSGVRRVRVVETGAGQALNFSEIEVFTMMTVPEPSAAALAGFGLVVLLLRRRR